MYSGTCGGQRSLLVSSSLTLHLGILQMTVDLLNLCTGVVLMPCVLRRMEVRGQPAGAGFLPQLYPRVACRSSGLAVSSFTQYVVLRALYVIFETGFGQQARLYLLRPVIIGACVFICVLGILT